MEFSSKIQMKIGAHRGEQVRKVVLGMEMGPTGIGHRNIPCI